MMEIERIEQPTVEQFVVDFASRERPVILTGIIENWPAHDMWSFEYLASKIGDHKVKVAVPPDGPPEGYYRVTPNDGHRYEQIEFADFVQQTSNGEVPTFSAVGVRFPSLAAEIGHIAYPGYDNPDWLRISTQRYTTPLHYDSQQNLHALVTGRKRFTIFDRKDFSRLYPYPMFSGYPHMSQVYLPEPNLQQFPRFADATAYEVILEAGEILFVPPGWWHEVDTLAPSISVSFWGQMYSVWTRSYRHLQLPLHVRKLKQKIRRVSS